eukprot:FR737874.1.p1 GENE.FR737874.1~~FR737874.1.p1  ORF type:complete len:277 (+),score=25.83 FR737874.1:45-833(+)
MVLDIFEAVVVKELEATRRTMQKVNDLVLKPSGVTLASHISNQVTTAQEAAIKTLRKTCRDRESYFPQPPGRAYRSGPPVVKLGLDTRGRDDFVEYATDLVTQEMPLVLSFFPRPDDFWRAQDLPDGAVDELVRKLIEKCSGNDLLTPLEDLDEAFELEIQHITAKSFIAGLATGRPQHDNLGDKRVKPPPLLDMIKPNRPIISAKDFLWNGHAALELKGAATPMGGVANLEPRQWVNLFAGPGPLYSDLESNDQAQQNARQ